VAKIFPGYLGGFIRMATNGVDDRQKPLSHCRLQLRPGVDHALKDQVNRLRLASHPQNAVGDRLSQGPAAPNRFAGPGRSLR